MNSLIARIKSKNAISRDKKKSYWQNLLSGPSSFLSQFKQSSQSTHLTPEEYQKIVVDWNATQSDFEKDKTIVELFEEQVKKNPDETALIFEGNTLTFRELNERVNQLAHYLRGQKVRPNSFVAIYLEASFELIISVLSVLKAGAAYLPLDPNYPIDRIQFMLQDTQATILITHSKFVKHLGKMQKQICLDTDASLLKNQLRTNLSLVNRPADLAYIIYTSGSTGKPKGVLITHGNVCHFFHWFGRAISISNSDIIDFSSSISFDFSVPNTLFPVVTGAKIAISSETTKKDPRLYLNHLTTNQVSIVKLTPSYFRHLKEFVLPEESLPDLRLIIFGGESIYVDDIKDWVQQFPNLKILNEYGPTEATVATSWIIIDKDNINQFNDLIPIGKPVLNSELYILDKNLQPVPIGEIGELYIGGKGVAKGYLNRAEITAKKFIKNPFTRQSSSMLYKTGDLCLYLNDGNIEFRGRTDHQIKIRGFRVEIGEIDKCLSSHPLIKKAVVIAKEPVDKSHEKKLVAFYVSKSNETLNIRELRDHISETLPEYMIPAAFVNIESIPLSPNGKIDYKALNNMEFTMEHSCFHPRTELEGKVHEIWSQVLNMDQISINDNFFELGGHSLSAARIINKIDKVLGKQITLQDFYNAPTIFELAGIIEQAKNSDVITYTQYKNTNSIPLSDLQLIFWFLNNFYPESKGLNIINRKRVLGKINIATLKLAFDYAFQKHEILTYNLSRYLPIQFKIKHPNFSIEEQDLSSFSTEEQEVMLKTSLDQLEKFHSWEKNSPLIIAKLFYLSDDESELQIGMSLFISDEESSEILFSDLSYFYTTLQKAIVSEEMQYKQYIAYEKENMNKNLQKDISFWEEYLQDTELFNFPPTDVIENIKSQNITFVSQFKLPENTVKSLREFCSENCVSISDSLCAVVAMALSEYLNYSSQNDKHNIIFNLVKSTRDNEIYDNMIGCFLRSDLIKVGLSHHDNFFNLSNTIQKSVITAAPHQDCSAIVKIACSLKKYWQNKKILNFFIVMGTFCFVKLFPKLKLNNLVLKMYGMVFSAGIKNNFVISINIMNSFVSNVTSHEKSLFGFKVKKSPRRQDDKMVVKNVLEITFDRDDQNQGFVILKGNLTPELRDKIGNKIINIICKMVKTHASATI
ncbi:MAG: amino acid adenylation domain-containing protein [Gammaproteobacteria bacterium]